MPVTRNSEHPRLGNKLLFVWGLLIFSIWGIYELAKVILVMVTGFALILFWLSVALLCIIGTVAGFNYLFTFVPHLPTSWKFAIAILLCATVIAIGLFVRRYFWRLSKIERSDLLAADWTSTWISFRQKRIICYATHSAKYLYLLTANPLLALKLAGVPAIYKNVHVGIKIDVSHPSIGNSPPTYNLWVYVRRTDARSVAALRATRLAPVGMHCALSIDIPLPDKVIPKKYQTTGFSTETKMDDPEVQSINEDELYWLNKKLDKFYIENVYEPWTINPKSLFAKYYWLVGGLISATLTCTIFFQSGENWTNQALRQTGETYQDLALSFSHVIAAAISIPIVSLVAGFIRTSKSNFLETSELNEVFSISQKMSLEGIAVSLACSFGFLFAFMLYF